MISSKEAIGLVDHRTVIKRLAEIEYNNGFHGKEACAHALKKAEKQAIEALEKQIAKRPYYEGDGYDPEGELIYDTWRCPNCGEAYEVDYDEYDYCPNCGQRIDWSEEDDKQGDRKANKGNDETE